MKHKVTVVGGAGNVGATVARAIAEKELADVVIIDIADQKAAGVALDMYETCPILGSDSRIIGCNDWAAAAGSRRCGGPASVNARRHRTASATCHRDWTCAIHRLFIISSFQPNFGIGVHT